MRGEELLFRRPSRAGDCVILLNHGGHSLRRKNSCEAIRPSRNARASSLGTATVTSASSLTNAFSDSANFCLCEVRYHFVAVGLKASSAICHGSAAVVLCRSRLRLVFPQPPAVAAGVSAQAGACRAGAGGTSAGSELAF